MPSSAEVFAEQKRAQKAARDAAKVSQAGTKLPPLKKSQKGNKQGGRGGRVVPEVSSEESDDSDGGGGTGGGGRVKAPRTIAKRAPNQRGGGGGGRRGSISRTLDSLGKRRQSIILGFEQRRGSIGAALGAGARRSSVFGQVRRRARER